MNQIEVAALPDVFSYTGEFSQELTLFIPFMTYLSDNNLLKDKSIEIQHGMEGFYQHIKCKDKIRKNVRRHHMSQDEAPSWLPCKHEHTATLHPHMVFVDHRDIFKEAAAQIKLPSAKPLLIIHNKHNMEWETGGPVNFINGPTLDYLITNLKKNYQVIYTRPGYNKLPDSYSRDDNTIIDTDEDRRVVKRHPEIIVLDDMWNEYKHIMNYNTFKGGMYAKCYKFITTQGGAAYQCACYSSSEIHILHKRGEETVFAYEHGVFKYLSDPPPLLRIYNCEDELRRCVSHLEQ